MAANKRMFLRHLFLELFIALRYLRGQGRTVIFNLGTRLSFFFMALMVYIMVLVLCVFTGFQKEVHNSLWNSGYHVVVSRQPAGLPMRNYKQIVEGVANDAKLEGLTRSVFPSVQLNALLEIDNRFEGKGVRAIPATDEELRTGKLKDYPRLVHYNRDYLRNFNDGNYVLVGRELARYFGWRVGHRIRLFVPRGGVLTRGIQVREAEFTIAGFFRTGFYEFDMNLLFVSLPSAQRVLQLGDQASEVIVQLNDLSQLERVERLVRDGLPKPRFDYSIRTIKQEKGNFIAALELEKTLMMIILSLLILAGVAGIWVTVHLLVKSKTRSIGMLRAMGLPNGSITIIFTAHSMLIGFLATAVGGSIGIFVANRLEAILELIEDFRDAMCEWIFGACSLRPLIPSNIYYFDHLPVEADPNVIFGVAVVTLILSGLAGYFPSRRAAEVDPVQVIRNE